MRLDLAPFIAEGTSGRTLSSSRMVMLHTPRDLMPDISYASVVKVTLDLWPQDDGGWKPHLYLFVALVCMVRGWVGGAHA